MRNITGEILKPPENIITVEGENVEFNCLIRGNSDTEYLASYWGVTVATKREKYVFNNYTYPQFFTAIYPSCSTDNGSCNFVSQLIIQNVSLEYNDTTLKCIENLDGRKKSYCEKNAKLSKQN